MTNVEPHNAETPLAAGKPKPLVVLVIEDDPFFRDVMVEALERAGFQTQAAENGLVGLKIALAHKIDIVVTDLFMPEKEGMETIRSLRDRFAFMPILVVSGGIAGQRSDFLGMSVRLGASAAISKPFLPSELVQAVRKLATAAGLLPAA
ncbi:MAG: response regulator [Telmatospirillum sp.]|nr:response regulator [Telmatospirillum sp.]